VNLVAAWLSSMFVALLVGTLTGAWPPPVTARRRRAVESGSWLTQAGFNLTPTQFNLLVAGAMAAVFLTFWSLSGVWAVALPPALGTLLFPRAMVARRRSQRLMEIQRAWPDGIRDLIASISAGMSLGRSLERLSTDGPLPLRKAFSRYPQLARVLGVAGALEVIKAEQSHPASDRVVEVLILAQDRGGGVVVEILRDLAAATTRDVWAVEEIETLALEQKINARIVFAVPWLMLVFLTVRPGPFRDFYRSLAGMAVIAIGGLLSLLGMWLVGRLGKEPDEPRVFGGRS
jgi:Flp pilus assembly protein TadB